MSLGVSMKSSRPQKHALFRKVDFGRPIIVFRRPLAWVSLLLALLCIGVGTLFLLQVLDGSKG